MKIRTSFISNSSTASYVLYKNKLTQKQIDMIYNHIKYANIFLFLNAKRKSLDKGDSFDKDEWGYSIQGGSVENGDAWQVDEDGDLLHVHTFMDNFEMPWFFEQIGVTADMIKESDGENIDDDRRYNRYFKT